MHFHGYEWAGDGRLLVRESERRPIEGSGFRLSELPPMMTGWWLLRPPAQVRGTWAAPTDAAEWLAERYEEHTPGGDSWLPTETRRQYAIAQLAGASDVVWSRWVSDSRWAGQYVVVCPNKAWPQVTCPVKRRP
ncbi:hypothetical protein [Streptomyces sp. FH025]|uniref:hypothetical protein n=1 Tax=Streptomyces sp. FH025 TaxID=2815937 RepID=UPI001A9F5E9F|nr:hypothetical protein [Streptomyces sp. FH025]MBO1413908.1 hypothetical protein [Streptomyces sp. FH025]